MDAWHERRRLDQDLADLLVELGDLRTKMEAAPTGLIGRFRRRWIARQAARLEGRLADLQARWAALPDGD